MKHVASGCRPVLLAGLAALALVGAALARPDDAVRLVPLSQSKLEHCERSGLLRPVCPRLVPEVGAAYLSNLSVELAGRSGGDVFNLERGGEDPRHPERNRPPRMAHVVAVAGNVERLAPLREPRSTTGERVRDGVMRRVRTAPVSFGRVRWAERAGQLYLMPPFPHGGMLSNHLVFGWREGARRYGLSMHAWEPLTESVATLRAMVSGLPTRAGAERLRRLSPVQRLALPRGRVSARATIAAPSPRDHAFDVYVAAPVRADVGLRIETATGQTLRILDST